ncbi:outer membrane beta-barrel protein [Gaoshiqia sediminis]|uniref:PorT family protein n=1 Tax=Gaoshiqia sediminis TaxID=2986998 RepID=A0AA42C9Q1_9BACT|nr:outer membrane beta-barrel protein [Gaoshiqia sediminis]MCW0482435.1 PorT family protein [Gaoshiqia sediminis]
MMKSDHQLDELFRSRLENFEQSPPPYVWDRIQELQAAGRKRRLVLILRASGVAAAILLAFLLGWQLQPDQPENVIEPFVVQQEQGDQPVPKLAGKSIEVTETSPVQESAPAYETVLHTKQPLAQVVGKTETEQSQGALPAEKEEALPLLNARSANLKSTTTRNLRLDKLKEKRQGLAVELSGAELALVEFNKQQAGNKSADRDGFWMVGAMITPVYAVNQSSYDAAYASNMTRSGGSGSLQLGGGLSLEYKAGKRWSVQSGLYYSKLEEASGNTPSRNMQYDFVSGDAEYNYFNTSVMVEKGAMLINASAGVVELDNLPEGTRLSTSLESVQANREVILSHSQFEQQFEYIEIPLMASYQLLDKTFRFRLLGGVNAGFLIGNNAYMQNSEGLSRIGKTKDMNRISYSTSFGFGLGYRLTDRLELRVDPQLKYYLGSLNDNPSVTYKPYSFGVFTGINYRF